MMKKIQPRKQLIEQAFKSVTGLYTGGAIFANGGHYAYGCTLPNDNSGRIQYKVEVSYNHINPIAMTVVCEIIEKDPRVQRAYTTAGGMLRVNFHKAYGASEIG